MQLQLPCLEEDNFSALVEKKNLSFLKTMIEQIKNQTKMAPKRMTA